MAVQIYSKDFGVCRNTSYYSYENDEDVRKNALKNVNEFLLKHDSIDIVNIIEDWSENRSFLRLIVYYKSYV